MQIEYVKIQIFALICSVASLHFLGFAEEMIVLDQPGNVAAQPVGPIACEIPWHLGL